MSADSSQGEGVLALAKCEPLVQDPSAMSAESRHRAAVRALIRSRESSNIHDVETVIPAKKETTYFQQGEQRVVQALVQKHQALLTKEPEPIPKKERPAQTQPGGTSTVSLVKALIKKRETIIREPPTLPPVKEIEVKGVQALIRKRESRVKALIMKRERVK